MKIDPNAPAYPHPDNWMPDGTVKPASGLTIRAEFAARNHATIIGVILAIASKDMDADGVQRLLDGARARALAIGEADALIAALNAEPKP